MIKQPDEFAEEWILARSLEVAEITSETTLTAIKAEIATGLEQGESMQQIAKRIGVWFDKTKQWKAKMVARTEVIAASNEGALHRYELEGIHKSEFYPSPDACIDCTSLAGDYQTSESHGMIPVHPSCRCVFLPVV